MIKQFNPTKLTAQPFFQDLMAYLMKEGEVPLRQIKKAFPQVRTIDRSIDSYVDAGFLIRQNRRYRLALPLLRDLTAVRLDSQVFVDTNSPIYQELLDLTFETVLTNKTNDVQIIEMTGIEREELTLANYFHRLRTAQPLSSEQERLYAFLGDVNPQYALKYMTSFLLKSARKDVVKQKRPDIFVESLVILGYLNRLTAESYELTMTFDKEKLIFRKMEN